MPTAALHYNRYHPTLIHCYAIGREHLVPEHVRKLVPGSTASGWRKVDTMALIGHEVWDAQREALDLHEVFLRYQRLRTAVLTLVKVWASVADILHPILAHKEHSERIVNAMQLLFTIMPRERVFRLANISSSAFHDRLSRIKVRCGLSPAERCFARHPLQLALREVDAIKTLFADPDLVCWPGVSLYYEGLRNRGLQMALSTFYKYTALLGLKRKPRKRIDKTVGLRATRPNEYLHVDTTHHELERGIKASIVFVSDNFSKAILGWHVALGKHAANVVEALRDTVHTIRQHHPEQTCAVLVADGGSENHAVCVEELLRDTFPPYITKLIALKDIQFSNSPIEAINKIYKQYLRHYQPKTSAALLQVTEAFVRDYGSLRPHGSLKGLIPMEAYTMPELKLDFRQTIREARAIRIEENKLVNCSLCTSGLP